MYVQVRQGFESPEGELGKSLNVVVFDEPAEKKIHLTGVKAESGPDTDEALTGTAGETGQ